VFKCIGATKEKRYKELLALTNRRMKNGKVVIAYLAANIIYTNAQRPGIVKKTKVEEFINRHTTENGYVLSKIKDKCLQDYNSDVLTWIAWVSLADQLLV